MDSDDDPEYRPDSSESDGWHPEPPQSSQSSHPLRPKESTRKRRLKAVEPAPTISLPKRRKGLFNFQYLNLLNKEIRDAAAGIVVDETLDLASTQVGVVLWTPSEKHAFYEALGRLGRDDIAGIAARVGTKSPLEIRQYLMLLDEAERARRENDGRRQRALRPVDVPAAAELSTELCAALEQAADGIALRCEKYEASLEQKRWQGRWLITEQLARVLENQQRANNNTNDLPPFAELFTLRNWLRLSDHVFMNSSVVEDGNWRSISEDPPSIRATALSDFHSLALSITRRLVSATLYVAGSRVRAKRAGDRRNRTGGLVKIKDVQAAVASVGMTENSREFWAKAARRLRLDVYDDEKDDESEDEGEAEREDTSNKGESDDEDLDTEGEELFQSETSDQEYDASSEIHDAELETSSSTLIPSMPYDEVEAALGFPPPKHPSSHANLSQGFPIDLSSSSPSPSPSLPDSDSDTDTDSNVDAPTKPQDQDSASDSNPNSSDDENNPALALDLQEALTYNAASSSMALTSRSRDALRARIRLEHLLWADAERADMQASRREEERLWRVVHDGRGRVKEELFEEDEGGEGESKDREGEGGREPEMRRRSGLVDFEPDWRTHVEYYSEWEVTGGVKPGAVDEDDGE
ncbi:hypothetical protein F5Y11DRAFT_325351 [Daldinia sp. FL1419]|nr:hypothetical protein F5Y11DRAFT_325351 [Daldinia sp. FL1419]